MTQEHGEKWSHLKDTEILETDAEVSLLIGSDIPQALEPLEIWRGHRREPIILPKRHHMAKLVIQKCHEKCGHSGIE